MYIEGFDCSDYQGHIDWRTVAKSGKRFAIIKASEGTSGNQDTFQQNWHGAKQVHMQRIAYHFFYDGLDPDEQVNHYHSQVRDKGRFQYGDGGMVDVEEVSVTEPALTVTRLRRFVEKFWHDVDKGLLIYTNYDTWYNVLQNPTDDVLARCALVIAAYGPTVPHLQNWPGGAAMWQYSESGHVPGIDGNVDLDRFFGTPHQLHRILTTVPR